MARYRGTRMGSHRIVGVVNIIQEILDDCVR